MQYIDTPNIVKPKREIFLQNSEHCHRYQKISDINVIRELSETDPESCPIQWIESLYASYIENNLCERP